jgi:hypothetical protein
MVLGIERSEAALGADIILVLLDFIATQLVVMGAGPVNV